MRAGRTLRYPDEAGRTFEAHRRGTASPFERNVLRRVFYSWFRVISTLSLRLAADDPTRIAMIHNLELAAQQTGVGTPDYSVPSYLRGAVAIGPEQNGTPPLLSMTGAN